ncbi:unnamed protein product [Orchesella dallaii]|uniref:Uncharacterized protein n=1 Tax=Orchesella dallaii TaxID=48710 RepID=A0ABP1PNQ2_9HEXA
MLPSDMGTVQASKDFTYYSTTLLYILINTIRVSSVVPDFYTAEQYTFIEVERNYSNYRTSLAKQFESSNKLIVNLNTNLQLFDGCLIHLINYDGLDFIPFQQPVILSRYDVVHVKYKAINKNPSSSIYISTSPRYSLRSRTFPFEKMPGNKTEIPWCRRYWPDLQCIDIPYLDMSSKAKPWTCEAHLYLFPPSPEQDPTFYERLYDRQRFNLLLPAGYRQIWSNWWPFYLHVNDDKIFYKFDSIHPLTSNRRWYDILISQNMEESIVGPWKNALKEMSAAHQGFSTSNRELLLVPVLPQPQIHHALGQRTTYYPVNIGSITVLCRNCIRCSTLQPVNIGTPQNFPELNQIIDQLNKNIEQILWKVYGVGEMVKMLKTHSGKEKHSDLHSSIRDNSLEALIWRLNGRLLAAVFNNATFQSMFDTPPDKQTECGWDDARIHDYDPIIHIFLTGKSDYSHFLDHRYSLKFVSCGRPATNTLAFSELISIFDTHTWVYLNVFTVVVALLSSYGSWVQKGEAKGHPQEIGTLSNYFHEYCIPSFLSYFKVLVEQGDPITVSLFKIPFLRWIYLSFMAVGIVISTAYKNDNISMLTLPLQPIPYENFDQLVEHKFDIFTRGFFWTGVSIDVAISLVNLSSLGIPLFEQNDTVSMGLDFFKPSSTHDNHDISYLLQSELMQYARSERSQRNRIVEKSYFSNRTQYLLNQTKLHHRWWELLNGKVKNFDLIKICNKTAFLLPEIEAYPLYYELLKKNFKDVYMSKETLFSLSYGLSFFRSVNPFVLKRLQGLVSSNIMEFWNRFLVKFMTSVKSGYGGGTIVETNEPMASDMQGNIVVVFTLLPLGLLGSTVLFVVEIRHKIRKYCCAIYKCMKR